MKNQTIRRSLTRRIQRSMALMTLRRKLLFALGILIFGLILVGGVAGYASISIQRLVNRTLDQQRQFTDLTTRITANLFDNQNRVSTFYDNWTLTGYERQVERGGFNYARETYLEPILDQLNSIRSDILALYEIEVHETATETDTLVSLDKMLVSLDDYEFTLREVADAMEELGYRDMGYMGQLKTTYETLQALLEGPDLENLQAILYRIDQNTKSYLLNFDFHYISAVPQSIRAFKQELAATDSTVLPDETRHQAEILIDSYYDYFLGAAAVSRKLQERRPSLVNESGLVSVLVQQQYEENIAEFDARIAGLRAQQGQSFTFTSILTIVVLVVSVSTAYYVTGQITRPIRALGRVAERLGAGELNVRADVETRDEIGTTAAAFNLMADQLQELLSELEQRVADRTRELEATAASLAARSAELEIAHENQMRINAELEETIRQSQRRAALLQAGVQVSRASTQIRDLNQLLPEVTKLISRHFGFYHAGIFLIDEAGRYAVLRAANSPGGQRMLARSHRLRVGSEGIVGHVTATGEPRIALDVGADAFFFNNPDLPETRSEMAVPLAIGDEIIGALDVQSTAEAAFEEQDVRVLTALADQLAIAIENAQLFERTQAALQEAQHAQRIYLRQEWERYTRKQTRLTHEYTLTGVPPAGKTPPEAVQALSTGDIVVIESGDHDASGNGQENMPVRAALAAPIKFRGETIGVLNLQETDDERVWTEDEIALVQTVADQVGQALESMRLFDEIQRRAQREQLIRQITDKVRSTTNLEAILETTVQEVTRAMGLPRAFIRLSLDDDLKSETQA